MSHKLSRSIIYTICAMIGCGIVMIFTKNQNWFEMLISCGIASSLGFYTDYVVYQKELKKFEINQK